MADRTPLPRNLRAGLVLVAILGTVGLTAPWLARREPWLSRDGRTLLAAPIPHDPNDVALASRLQPPSPRHWLGTDDLGRDVAARVVHGARSSLAVGVLAAALSLCFGVPLGAWAGYRKGWIDFGVSRVVEATLAVPTLLLALAALAVAEGWLRAIPQVARIALVVGLTGWTPAARYIRAEFLKLRASEMVQAARALGAGDAWIARRYILPSALAPVLVAAAFAVGGAIGLEAALSFLGLGIRPPHATLGSLLAESREHLHHAWWLAVFPGAVLFGAILSCSLVAEGIRDLLDPRSRRE